ncbi:MAG TPA: hypothetical protein VLM89_17610 [Phycisphaerae bacterium]|nr:hypothetical protein [Phycisphaerae bacterium]
MPGSDLDVAFTLLAMALGSGVFLRLVGKEKHRREKWLQFRLEEEIKKLKNKKEVKEV